MMTDEIPCGRSITNLGVLRLGQPYMTRLILLLGNQEILWTKAIVVIKKRVLLQLSAS